MKFFVTDAGFLYPNIWTKSSFHVTIRRLGHDSILHKMNDGYRFKPQNNWTYDVIVQVKTEDSPVGYPLALITDGLGRYAFIEAGRGGRYIEEEQVSDCGKCSGGCKKNSVAMIGRIEINRDEIKRPTDGFPSGARVRLDSGETGHIVDVSRWNLLGVHVDQIHAVRFFDPRFVYLEPEETPLPGSDD